MNPAVERAQTGSGAPLTKRQKRMIGKLAREAWVRAGCPFYDEIAIMTNDSTALSASAALELWRHEEQLLACGVKHLTTATQREFPALMSHFNDRCGRVRASRSWFFRGVGDPARQARAVLQRELLRASRVLGSPTAYIESIAARQFKCAVSDCTAKQIWSLVFTLRNRMNKKRRKGAP